MVAQIQLGRHEEASEMFGLAIELGSTGPNFGAEAAVRSECNGDVDCVVDSLPPFMQPMANQFRIILRSPEREGGAEESLELAYQMLDDNPDLTNMFNAVSCAKKHLIPLFFYAWESHHESGAYWYWPNVWANSLGRDCSGVWSDPRFSELVEEVGLVEYWREVGWPEACQPEGEGFECGRRDGAGVRDRGGRRRGDYTLRWPGTASSRSRASACSLQNPMARLRRYAVKAWTFVTNSSFWQLALFKFVACVNKCFFFKPVFLLTTVELYAHRVS